MADYSLKYLPNAIYLDTNVLHAAGVGLEAPWLNELIAICKDYKIQLCLSELVVCEWCQHIAEELKKERGRLTTALTKLKQYGAVAQDLATPQLNFPDNERLSEIVRNLLEDVGFLIVPNALPPLTQLLEEAVLKTPPFGEGGKGLCDAVILESYVKHAKSQFPEGRVLVVSNDNDVRRSEQRFRKASVAVEFTQTGQIVDNVTSRLDEEGKAIIEHRRAKLKQFIRNCEEQVLDYVRLSEIEVTTDPPIGYGSFGERFSGPVERLISIQPIGVKSASGGVWPYGVDAVEGRYPIQIEVEMEVEGIVRGYFGKPFGFLQPSRTKVQPSRVSAESPIVPQNPLIWPPREYTEKVSRYVTVLATIDAAKEKEGELVDLHFEMVV